MACDGGRGRAQGWGCPACVAGRGIPGEGCAAGQTKTLEKLQDLVATNAVLRIQARNTDLRQAAAEDKLEQH